MPALTVNGYGSGQAYYVASRNEHRFQADFYRHLIDILGLRRALGCELPDGVTAAIRGNGRDDFIFVLGFNREPVVVTLPGDVPYSDVLTGVRVEGRLEIPPYSTRILKTPSPGISVRG